MRNPCVAQPLRTLQECKRSGVNWISPEHLLLAMLAMPECNGRRVLEQ
jgi:hypothetical protein